MNVTPTSGNSCLHHFTMRLLCHQCHVFIDILFMFWSCINNTILFISILLVCHQYHAFVSILSAFCYCMNFLRCPEFCQFIISVVCSSVYCLHLVVLFPCFLPPWMRLHQMDRVSKMVEREIYDKRFKQVKKKMSYKG